MARVNRVLALALLLCAVFGLFAETHAAALAVVGCDDADCPAGCCFVNGCYTNPLHCAFAKALRAKEVDLAPTATKTVAPASGALETPLPDGSPCSLDKPSDCASHCCHPTTKICSNPVTGCPNAVPRGVGLALASTCTANSQCESKCCNGGVCSRYGKCVGNSIPWSQIPEEALDFNYKNLSIRIYSPTQWCLMFPEKWEFISGDHEFEAKILCSEAMVKASGGSLPAAPTNILPKAWIGKGDDGNGTSWIQMSSRSLSNAPYNPQDTGTQYDSDGEPIPSLPGTGAPRGSGCLGYDNYVQLFNPQLGNLCVRCCKGPRKDEFCSWKWSGTNCEYVFPNIQFSEE